jgi:hypothetical protein
MHAAVKLNHREKDSMYSTLVENARAYKLIVANPKLFPLIISMHKAGYNVEGAHLGGLLNSTNGSTEPLPLYCAVNFSSAEPPHHLTEAIAGTDNHVLWTTAAFNTPPTLTIKAKGRYSFHEHEKAQLDTFERKNLRNPHLHLTIEPHQATLTWRPHPAIALNPQNIAHFKSYGDAFLADYQVTFHPRKTLYHLHGRAATLDNLQESILPLAYRLHTIASQKSL